MCIRTYWTVLSIVLGLNTSASNLFAEERHYMLIFGAQTEPNVPRLTHTYALFVKVPEAKFGKGSEKLEQVSISWLPKSLSVEPLRRTPEEGVNLGLAETNKLYASLNTDVAMWGPYRIKKELYVMAVKQAERLNKNAISYICIDLRYRGGVASNCIHAVSDLDTTQPLLGTGTARGQGASEIVVRHFESYIIPSKEDTAWLTDRLKLKPTEIRFVNAQTPTPPVKAQP